LVLAGWQVDVGKQGSRHDMGGLALQDRIERGEFTVYGKKVAIHSTMDAKKLSIGLGPEDRKDEGLAVEFSVMKNITITNLARVSRGWFLSRRREAAARE